MKKETFEDTFAITKRPRRFQVMCKREGEEHREGDRGRETVVGGWVGGGVYV